MLVLFETPAGYSLFQVRVDMWQAFRGMTYRNLDELGHAWWSLAEASLCYV